VQTRCCTATAVQPLDTLPAVVVGCVERAHAWLCTYSLMCRLGSGFSTRCRSTCCCCCCRYYWCSPPPRISLPLLAPAMNSRVQVAVPAALVALASAPSSQPAADSPRVRPSAAHSHSHRLGSLGLQAPCLGSIAPPTAESVHASPARWLHQMLTPRGHALPVQRDIGREPGLRALSTTR
jgi:hypothetical protein